MDKVTADVTASQSGAYTNFVGGLVGYVADATSEVSFTNSAVTANLTYNNSTTKVDCTCLGRVIGMVGAVMIQNLQLVLSLIMSLLTEI